MSDLSRPDSPADRFGSAHEGLRSSRLEKRISHQPWPRPVFSAAGRSGPIIVAGQTAEGICSLHESKGFGIVIHVYRIHSLGVGAHFFQRRYRDLLRAPAAPALHKAEVLLRRVGCQVHDTRHMEPVSAARSLKDRPGGLQPLQAHGAIRSTSEGAVFEQARRGCVRKRPFVPQHAGWSTASHNAWLFKLRRCEFY